MNEVTRRKIGDIEVTTVSDGILDMNPARILSASRSGCARLRGGRSRGPIPISVNAYLLEFNGKKALVDAGCSVTMGPTLGKKLTENLRAHDVDPNSIDYVMLTHIHPDHSNGHR